MGMSLNQTIKIIPMGKPRQTQSDKWNKRSVVVRYREFADELRADWQGGVKTNNISIRFDMPMPKSQSEKKKNKMDGEPHQQKPDVDNLLKSFFDAIFKMFDADDCMIYDCRVSKYWAREGSITYEETES